MAISLLPSLQQPDDDTLAKILGTYKSPSVIGGGGPQGTIAQAKLGGSTAQPTSSTSLLPMFSQQDNVPMPSQDLTLLPALAAPSRASLGSTDADNALTAAQAKEKADTPQKYDWSQHSLLGKIGHVAGSIGNAIGDAYSPELMTLLPGTQLNKEARLFQDKQDVQKKTENAAKAGQELDVVNNEEANREAEAPLRDSTIAKNTAEAEKALRGPVATSPFELWHQSNPNGTLDDYNKAMSKPLTQQDADNRNAALDPILKKHSLPTGLITPGMSAADANATIQAAVTGMNQGRADTHITLEEHNSGRADAAATDKRTAAQTKAVAPYEGVLDAASDARSFAAQHDGPGDYALMMSFVEATKPKTGFRFTTTEQKLIQSARSYAQGAQAAYLGGKTGELFTPQQRQQMLDVIGIHEREAQRHLKSMGAAYDTGEQKPTDNSSAGPKVGDVRPGADGNYRFKGGDQYDKSSWEKVTK